MSHYAYKTNIALYNTNSGTKKRNSYHVRPKQLYKNHEAEQGINKPGRTWDEIAHNGTVDFIIKKFKGTLITHEIKTEYGICDIFEIAS